jgi:MOSC domain-containing protein YiiM
MPKLLSIQVGQPTTYGRDDAADPMDRTWTSAFFKSPIAGPVFVGRTNVAGDRQADTQHHGGVDKAVLAYAASHYAQWRAELDHANLPFGGFGENLTIEGLTEGNVCIGDVWSLGESRLQVSQPRQPCWKLARRWRRKELTARVVENGRCGWYLRVLQEGLIEAGQSLTLLERPNPDWTVARAHEVMHHRPSDPVATAELASIHELSDAWRTALQQRLSSPSR